MVVPRQFELRMRSRTQACLELVLNRAC
jgi:hypothetical protein